MTQASFDQGFGGTLQPGRRPAVLAIDLVRAYFEPGSELCLPDDGCLHSARRVIQAARAASVPVIHTRVQYAPDGIDGGVFVRKVAALRNMFGGGPLSELMPEVAPEPDELVVTKQYPSAFFATSLAATLRGDGIDTVIVTGVSTSGCVRATAVDAMQHGFVPLVVREACGDRGPGPHEANLYDLQAKYAEVVSEDAATRYLRTVGEGA